MKRYFTALLLTLSIFTTSVPASARTIREEALPESALRRIRNAFTFLNQGMEDASLMDFQDLLQTYPDNYTVLYEYAFALVHLNKMKEANAILKDVIKSPDAEPAAYTLYSASLDYLGKRTEALKILREGRKRFPNEGILYCESGLYYVQEQDYNNALFEFDCGMKADPNYDGNYFRAAQLLFHSRNMVWPLIYAESSILLSPRMDSRGQQMAEEMMEVYRHNITIDRKEQKVNIKLIPSRKLSIDFNDPFKGSVEFESVFEGCLGVSAAEMLDTDTTAYKATIRQVAELRRRAVDAYFSIARGIFGNRMYLYDYQKQVIESGHWDAYNYFLFCTANEQTREETDRWMEQNEDRMEAFIEWFKANPFKLDATRSVSESQINLDLPEMTMKEALEITAGLLSDSKKRKSGKGLQQDKAPESPSEAESGEQSPE